MAKGTGDSVGGMGGRDAGSRVVDYCGGEEGLRVGKERERDTSSAKIFTVFSCLW